MLYIIIVSLELLMKRLMDGFLTLSSFNEEYENKAWFGKAGFFVSVELHNSSVCKWGMSGLKIYVSIIY